MGLRALLSSLLGETPEAAPSSPRRASFEQRYARHVDERHAEILRRLAEEHGVPGASRFADYELSGGFLPLRYAAEVLGQSQRQVVEQVERGLLQARSEDGELYVQPNRLHPAGEAGERVMRRGTPNLCGTSQPARCAASEEA